MIGQFLRPLAIYIMIIYILLNCDLLEVHSVPVVVLASIGPSARPYHGTATAWRTFHLELCAV